MNRDWAGLRAVPRLHKTNQPRVGSHRTVCPNDFSPVSHEPHETGASSILVRSGLVCQAGGLKCGCHVNKSRSQQNEPVRLMQSVMIKFKFYYF